MPTDPALVRALKQRGVIIHAPAATVIRDIDPNRFEEGVEVHPGTTVCGRESQFGAGTHLGRAGGGWFENVRAGRNVDLYGGYFNDCVLLDGVQMRGHAEVRGGTLLEEGCEAAHHVGYKMTVMLPWVVAGSLVNFCDALVAGGRGRKEHSEMGSTLALYNFTPWGDKFASLFGDVPRGVLLREDPIFIGGQTQIVSPVHVGFGALLPAGTGVRRNVPDGAMYGEAGSGFDGAFDRTVYGSLRAKFQTTIRYVANLAALRVWYEHVRIPCAGGDTFLVRLYRAAVAQLDAGVAERIKRLSKIVPRLEASLDAHRKALDARADGLSFAQRNRRIDDHEAIIAAWPSIENELTEVAEGLEVPEGTEAHTALSAVVDAYRATLSQHGERPLVEFLLSDLTDETGDAAAAGLERLVEGVLERAAIKPA